MSPRSFALVATVVALLAGAASSAADPKADATALNAEGHKLFTAKDFAGAVVRFQRAYEIYPSAGLLLNLGTALQQMGRTVEAANIYQRYLDDPGAQEPYATQTRQSLAIADTLAGRLTIAVSADSEIQIGDGEWIPVSHGHVIRVAPGSFIIRARAAGRTAESAGRIGAGESRTIQLALAASAPAPVAVTSSDPEDKLDPVELPTRPRRSAALVAGGGGLVLAASSIALVVRSSTLYGRASSACHGDPSCAGGDVARARTLADGARTDRMFGLGLGVAAAAAIGTGAYLWFRTPRRGDVAISVVTASGHFGLALDGRF